MKLEVLFPLLDAYSHQVASSYFGRKQKDKRDPSSILNEGTTIDVHLHHFVLSEKKKKNY